MQQGQKLSDKTVELSQTKSQCDHTQNRSYNVSQPPLSTVVSNFLATRVGIPWLSHVFLISSNRAVCKYCLLPRLMKPDGELIKCASRTLDIPHGHIHFTVVIKIRRRRKSALVDVQIQQRASLDQEIDPDSSTASSGVESAQEITLSRKKKTHSRVWTLHSPRSPLSLSTQQ